MINLVDVIEKIKKIEKDLKGMGESKKWDRSLARGVENGMT